MHEVVESIRRQWCREFGFPDDSPPGSTYFYRDHGPRYKCGCARYFELLDACPVRIPRPTVE